MPTMITSARNPHVVRAIRLRERRHRDREGLMLIEGYAELSLALASGVRPQAIFVCPDIARDWDAASRPERVRASGADLIQVSPRVFEKMAYRQNPDGWLAVAPARRRRLDDLALGPAPLLLVVEAVEKPGNLGAILRTADAAGVDAVIVCDPTTDVNNPNVVRASKGTLFSVSVVEAGGAETLAWLRARRITVVAATPQAKLAFTQADLRGPAAIAVGREDAGLSRAWLKGADVMVCIPMFGRINSLNVATATALLVYEAVRQRRSATA
jgi:TrmH family RNA methyltransferase